MAFSPEELLDIYLASEAFKANKGEAFRQALERRTPMVVVKNPTYIGTTLPTTPVPQANLKDPRPVTIPAVPVVEDPPAPPPPEPEPEAIKVRKAPIEKEDW